MPFNPGDRYYFKGFGAPFQIYTITYVDVVKQTLHTTESSAGVNNEMFKWYNIRDFENYINQGLIIMVEV